MLLEQLRPTMKVVALYDSGLKAGDVLLYEVLKVGTAKVKVRDEQGREGWLYPAALHREIAEERYVEIMDETHGPEWRSRRGDDGRASPAP